MSNTAKPEYIVRAMQVSDCEEVRQMTVGKFSMPYYYNEILLKIDPEGNFVAQDLKTGKLLGLCNGTIISPELAFIGHYIVREEYRGLGIGSVIWQKVMEHIGPERNVSLYSSPKMIEKYKQKSSLNISPERVLILYKGIPDLNDMIDSIEGISLVAIKEDNIQEVIQYDSEVCDGLDRTVLIREISKCDKTVNLVAINDSNDVVGYCIICVTLMNTCAVHPLYADNERIAELLLNKCCRLLSNTSADGLVYCCWSHNQKSIDIANRLALQVPNGKYEMPILFSKKVVDGNLDKIYCVSSLDAYPF